MPVFISGLKSLAPKSFGSQRAFHWAHNFNDFSTADMGGGTPGIGRSLFVGGTFGLASVMRLNEMRSNATLCLFNQST